MSCTTSCERLITRSVSVVTAIGGLCVLLLSGCSPAVDPAITKLRAELILTTAPGETVSILDAKELAKESPADIVLAAQVTSGEYAFWDEENAMFAVSEIDEEADNHGGEGHDPSTCPFCKRRRAALKDRRAMIKVVDSSGDVIPINARKLLDIDENQILVVHGKGEVDKTGNLIVSAHHIYLKR